MIILDSILLSPIKGLMWLGDKINDIVQKEIDNKDSLKEKLMELQLRFELDEISLEEYEEKEKELLERINQLED